MTTTSDPVAAREQLRNFASCAYEPEDIVEIRFLPSRESTYSKAGHLADRADHLFKQNEEGQHIYVGANPRKHVGGRDGKAVALARCVFVDFDNMTLEEVRQRLTESPPPTMLIATGHGYHAWWRLAQPIEDLASWTNLQKELIALVESDRAIHDPPRVMRLPGFRNHKEPAADAYIIDADPSRVYELSDLHKVVLERPAPAAIPSAPSAHAANSSAASGNLARCLAYLAKLPDSISGQRGHDALLRAACECWRFGFTEAEVMEALRWFNENKCSPRWNKSDLRRKADEALKKTMENGEVGMRLREPRGAVLSEALRDVPNYPPARQRLRKPASGSQKQGSCRRRQVGCFKPFPVEILPEPVRSFIWDVSMAIGCDPSFVALPLLAALAAAIGNTRRIRLSAAWTEPAVIWAVIIGESGTLKSPAIEAALRPIRQRQKEAFRIHDVEVKKHQQELRSYQQGTRATAANHSAISEKPKAVRYCVSDTTVEALAVNLSDNPRGLLLVCDELSGWLGSFNQYRAGGHGGDVAHWLEMHRAGELLVDRKGADRPTIYVPMAAMSITGGIQLDTLRRSLGSEHLENGLAARLLLAMPPRRAKRWSDREVGEATWSGLAAVFDGLYELASTQDANGNSQPVLIPLSDDARETWRQFVDAHGEEQLEYAGLLAATWSKLEAYAARFALIVHLVRFAAGDRGLASPDTVDRESVEAGIELTRWFGQEARRSCSILAEGPADRQRRELVELVSRLIAKKKHGEGVTVRELRQGSRRLRDDQEGAEAALDELVAAGLGQWRQPPRGTKAFMLTETVDTVNVNTCVAGEVDKEDTVDVDAVGAPEMTRPYSPQNRKTRTGGGMVGATTNDQWGEL
ncbi:MAG TPA: DUF3987 domain-containing protein [Phycisphaerae bacterium]|nr:DUF3987 domain-containing protein [Phycisphaerae bacterium]HRY67501.1 DUF3987 domain-containing protein [Phycisphaerae bacterium]HSA24888.1 DUF3987 domain-containing protein [Phycisphaerae bacterium]